ncbi:trypsin 5G1-like [Armigeres subalbatus]|uniref:trypsin 5G1-like n=1 Tax=Armigeres subalbatus TaxID=124917 RepID=UPI002ED1F938
MTAFGIFLTITSTFAASGLALPNLRLATRSTCSSDRIVGGYPANITDIPFQVSLQHQLGHFCGGSIISGRWILSAAHCAGSSDNPMINVRVGSSLSDEGGLLVAAKRFIQHPQYNFETLDYDVALLELSEELKLDDQFYAVQLPEQDEPVNDGTCLQVSGWGDTQNAYENGYQLKAATIPIVNQKECAQSYEWFGTVTPRMLCAGFDKGGNNACHGDSGGPLVMDGNKLVGVVSWSFGCAEKNHPTVFARVASVRSWIKEISGV